MCRDCKSNGISLFSEEKEREHMDIQPLNRISLLLINIITTYVRVAMLGLTEAQKNST
jgi:hypothetical protein